MDAGYGVGTAKNVEGTGRAQTIQHFHGSEVAHWRQAEAHFAGAIQAVESAGLKLGVADKGIVVVASNCMKDGIVHINSGQQYATATQIPTEEAEVTAKKVETYFNGGQLKKYEIVPVYGITKENVGRFAAGCSY